MDPVDVEEDKLLAERSQKRRPLVEQVVKRLHECRGERMSRENHRSPAWTEAEYQLLLPMTEKIKANELSYYRATLDAMKLMPGRTFSSIRKKLYCWVSFGRWTEYEKQRKYTMSSYKDGKLIHPPHAPKTK